MSKLNREERKVIEKDIKLVQHLIERCLLLYMGPDEIVKTLFQRANIVPAFTETVLHKMEEENPDFFAAYNMRLKLKDQILQFNRLIEKLAELKSQTQMSQSGVLPISLANGLLNHSMNNYSAFQDRTPVVPSLASENKQHLINVTPNFYANFASSRMQNAVGVHGHTDMNHMINGVTNFYANGASSHHASMREAVGIQGHTGMQHMINGIPTFYANGESSQQARKRDAVCMMQGHTGMRHMTNHIPSFYANGESSQQARMRDVVDMQGHTGMIDVRANMPMTQGSNAGIMNGLYGVDSQVMFCADNGLSEPCNVVGETSAPPFNGGETNLTTFIGDCNVVGETSAPHFNGGESTSTAFVGDCNVFGETSAPPFNGGGSTSMTFFGDCNVVGETSTLAGFNSSDLTTDFSNDILHNISLSPFPGGEGGFLAPDNSMPATTLDDFNFEAFDNDSFGRLWQ